MNRKTTNSNFKNETMKKKTVFILFAFCALHINIAFTQPIVSVKDFQLLIGNWHGSLTYLDYTTNKPYTMPANITITPIGRTNSFLFANSFPEEPNASWTDTILISADGRMINDETVKSKQLLKNGALQIITEVLSIDGNEKKPALLKYTYTMGKNSFIKRKEVQFTGDKKWIQRHEYSYKKVKTRSSKK